MKRIILTILLLIIMLFCTSCTINSPSYSPRIALQPTQWKDENIEIKLRPNHQFAEDLYSIEETEYGYNIIIHCIKYIKEK